jgi:hypothetical protein
VKMKTPTEIIISGHGDSVRSKLVFDKVDNIYIENARAKLNVIERFSL